MNNLKRVLSLGLSGAMLAGMVTIGASAANTDFTDASEIEHTEAVNTLVALNVINGKDDGSYDPTGSLTRAEMAKLAVYVLNGGKDPVLGTKTTPTYTDIGGHWAEKYIEYCSSTGIINGQGDGTFAPDGTLTGSQAAKMLLTAMGYNADVFSLTGEDWEINTNREANDAGLYEDLDGMDPSATITRDQAAQLVYNAIQSPLMIRSWTQDQTTGTVTEAYNLSGSTGGTPKTLLSDKFGGAINVGYLTGYTYDAAKGQWTYSFTAADSFNSGAITETTAFASATSLKSTEDYTALFGQKVKVVYKSSVNDSVYGVYAHDSVVLEEGASGDIGTIDSTAKTVKVNGTAYKVNAASTAATNLVYNNNVATATGETLANLKDSNDSFTFKVIDNDDDGKVDCIITTPIVIGKINYVGSDSITVTSPVGTTPDIEDIDIYEGYAKGDWVAFVDGTYTATGRDTYTKLDLVDGTIDGVRTTTGEYRIGGSWYQKGNNSNVSGVSLGINDSIEYVALGSYIFYAKVSESSTSIDDVAMVITTGEDTNMSTVSSSSVKAKLLFADGTKKTVTVATINGSDATYNATYSSSADTNVTARIGKLVTYSVNSDGEYELKDVSSTNKAGYKGVGDNSTYSSKTVGGYELADDAVVFVLTGTGVATLTAASGNTGKVYTGKEIKNAYGSNSITGAVALTLAGSNANVACLYDTTDGFTYAKVAVINTTGALVINSGSSYGYLVSNAYETKEDGTTYTNLKFWNGSENVEAKWEKSGVLDLYKSGVIITYDTVDSETVKNVSVVDATVGVVKGWDGTKKIQLDSISREISSDTVVLVVDSKNKKGVVGDASSIQIGEDTDADDVADQANVRYVTGATYVDLIVVDTSNKMYAAPVVTIAASSLNDASALTTAFKNADKIIVDEAYQIPSGVTIASGKTLEVTGALTQSGSTIVNGTLIASGTATLSANVTGTGTLKVVNFTDAATSAAFAQTSTVNITGSVTAATLEAVPVVEGKTLIVGAQSSDNGSASKWYSAAGSAATEGSNGVAGTDTISSSKIQAGTYVGTTVYSGGTDATGTAAWVKQ